MWRVWGSFLKYCHRWATLTLCPLEEAFAALPAVPCANNKASPPLSASSFCPFLLHSWVQALRVCGWEFRLRGLQKGRKMFVFCRERRRGRTQNENEKASKHHACWEQSARCLRCWFWTDFLASRKETQAGGRRSQPALRSILFGPIGVGRWRMGGGSSFESEAYVWLRKTLFPQVCPLTATGRHISSWRHCGGTVAEAAPRGIRSRQPWGCMIIHICCCPPHAHPTAEHMHTHTLTHLPTVHYGHQGGSWAVTSPL